MPPLGTINNPKGRGKGIPNKITKDLRIQISDILAEHFTPEKVSENLEAMEPKERLIFLIKLLDYSIPKLRQTDLKTDLGDNVITVIPPSWEFSPEDRAARIKELKEKLFQDEK